MVIKVVINSGVGMLSLSPEVERLYKERLGDAWEPGMLDFDKLDREDPWLIHTIEQIGLEESAGAVGTRLEIVELVRHTMYKIKMHSNGHETIIYNEDMNTWRIAGLY